MPGATIGNPTPAWLRPENRSVLDPTMLKLARALASLVGMDDPQSQVVNLMTPMVPTGQETLGPIARVGQALAKKIKAYHGSPHDFDQFSLSKIGTGEGAQAYGHGLYFAENEGVAGEYRKALSRVNASEYTAPSEAVAMFKRAFPSGVAHDLGLYGNVTPDHLAQEMFSRHGNGELPAHIRRDLRLHGIDPDAFTNLLRQSKPKGHTYEVEIAADPDTLLDWDTPLSQQSPQVRNAVHRAARDTQAYGLDRVTDGMRPVEMKRLVTSPDGVQRLKELGVPGIKYLDGGSRGAGTGTRNYVIFDDALVTILKKYGVAIGVIEGLRRQAAANGGRLPAAAVDQAVTQ